MNPDVLATRYIRRMDLVAKNVVGETLLLDNVGEWIHQLNSTATFIWNCCDGKSSVNDIIRLMTQEFDVGKATAERDVIEIVEQLEDQGLLGRQE